MPAATGREQARRSAAAPRLARSYWAELAVTLTGLVDAARRSEICLVNFVLETVLELHST